MNIGNQQETEYIKNISWVAGIWDGEGTITIVKQRRKESKGGSVILFPKFTMENTNIVLIEKVCEIFDSLGVNFYINVRNKKADKHKDRFVINVCRLTEIKKICEILIPYLVSKKSQAKLLLRFVTSRIERLDIAKKKHINKLSANYYEKDLCETIQSKNKTEFTGSSTTLRGILTKQKGE